MKKWFAMIMALVIVLGMVGCGSSTKEPEPTATPVPVKISESKACLIAENSAKEMKDLLVSKNPLGYWHTIAYFKIGSSSATYVEEEEKYKVTIKGTFSPRDEYGQLGSTHKFYWVMDIDAYETDDLALEEAEAGDFNVIWR